MEILEEVKHHVFQFGEHRTDGNAQMRNLLGGKGANLAEIMSSLGIPVPPGFTITTKVCTTYNEKGKEETIEMIKSEVLLLMGRNIMKAIGSHSTALQGTLLKVKLALRNLL